MAPPLASLLIDLLATRRRQRLGHGWAEVPEWVFPSQTGGLFDQDNFDRTWRRLRRRAQKAGVHPLRLHCTRHTWALWRQGSPCDGWRISSATQTRR